MRSDDPCTVGGAARSGDGDDNLNDAFLRKAPPEPANWSRRYKQNVELLRTGEIVNVALVAHRLEARARDKGLSAGEQRMLERARSILEPADVVAIAASVDESYRPMVWLGALLGLRWGEAAGLTRGAVDLGQSTLTVDRQLGRDGRLGPPKSAAGTRTCALPSALAVVLRAHLESLGPAATHADQLVFAAPGGGPLDYSHWRHRVWLPAAAAGVPGAGFHDLRRANATALVAAGVDIKTAQTRLGHSDPRLTLTIYARAVPEADRAAAELLGARFFMPSPPASPVLPG